MTARRRAPGQLTSRRWRALKDRVVREEPLCTLRLECCTVRSTTADHIIPVKYRPDLKYVRANLRGACQPCNMRRGTRPLSEVRAAEKFARKPEPPKPVHALSFFDTNPRMRNLDFET
ncbi:HNH endonuclease [Mycobacterium phage NiebruSaylor]|nr:HNH endonuclease [Mycobacterium phage Catdawg]YP_010097520.1 HNH endonuclease [Mycobacterium phage Ryadel]ATW60510.1 HNH endonuclease [Mycobacterium phage Familton]AVP42682.1 HNH endonuclease [Mycobacterium phage SchoolBus]AYQ98864.1 HNH endonuclease [Mycobacterium phage Vorrps]QFP97073.1 HNH endonuclease [Mycobacterium phage Krili]QGJ87350.1 HNH endonuclease [Mycobacterium phage Blessica]QOC59226.1 HNH endonuclease [Mycobacterium phage NiebruSaylor]QPO16513.1 HNH endonuclease [Mycobacte